MKRTGHIIKIFAFAAMLLLLLPLPAKGEEKQKLDVKKLVFEHLADDYSWHLFNVGERAISIPLPVIAYCKGDGWHVFFSSRLRNGETYQGLRIATEGTYSGKIVLKNNEGKDVRPALDLSYTKNALGITINCLVLLLIIIPLARWYKRGTMEPAKGFRGAVEMLLVDVQDTIIKPCVGDDYQRFSPYLLMAFFFIFVSNLIGIIPFFPGGANVTGNIAVTMILALCTFVAVNVCGTKGYWKEILWPDVPAWLKVPAPIMPVIELFGIFTKPFALMVRLFANIMAGHSVIIGLVSVIFITVSMGTAMNIGLSFVSVLFSVFMNLVEVLVAYIQAYVFTLLSAVFIGLSRVKQIKETKQINN